MKTINDVLTTAKNSKKKKDEEICSIVSYTISEGNKNEYQVMDSYLEACYDVDVDGC